MAIEVEFVNVILRKSALERHLPGGVDDLAQRPLANFAEDEHLVRIGFMSTFEALTLISEVEALAAPAFRFDGNAAIIEWEARPYPAWLSVGMIEDYPACWLASAPPGARVQLDRGMVVSCSGATEHDVMEWLSAAVPLSRAEPDADGDLWLTYTRDDALVDVRLLEVDDGVFAMLRRRLSRRRQRDADLGLAGDLIEALREHGGHARG